MVSFFERHAITILLCVCEFLFLSRTRLCRYPGKWVLKPSESPRDIWGNEDNQIGSDSSMESMREQKRMRLSSFDPSAPPNQRNTGSNEDKHKGDDRFWHTSSACWLKNALPQFDELPRCSVEESFEDPLCYPNLHPLDEMQMTNDQHDFRSPKDGLVSLMQGEASPET